VAVATRRFKKGHSTNEGAQHFDEKLGIGKIVWIAAIEGSIEAFSHRVDSEVEERHVLGERVLKLEKAV
jgi:hypothetical protein